MARNSECGRPADRKFIPARAEIVRHIRPYRGLFPSPPLFDRMPTYRTQGKRSLNFLSADPVGADVAICPIPFVC